MVVSRSAMPQQRNVVAATVNNCGTVCRLSKKKSVAGTATPMMMTPTISLKPDTPVIQSQLSALPQLLCSCFGGTRVGNPTSLVGDGSLRRLADQLGVDALDPRRFRMLIELEDAAEHEEDTWIGRDVAVGSAVLHVTMPDARCAITTQDPDAGVRDLDTLRGIIAYRGLRAGKHADFGVLADVAVPGRVAVGDEARPLD